MATDKPRFTITLDPDMLASVLKYKEKNRLSTQSKAIQQLIELGIHDTQEGSGFVTLALKPDEQTLVEDYRELNKVGREYIRQTMAMAKQAYSGKNDALPQLEDAK